MPGAKHKRSINVENAKTSTKHDKPNVPTRPEAAKKINELQVRIDKTRDDTISNIRGDHLTVENRRTRARSGSRGGLFKSEPSITAIDCANLNKSMNMLLQSTVRLAFTNDPDIDKRYENLQTLSSQSDRLIKSSEFKKLITYKDSCEPVEKYIGAVSAIGKYIYFNAEKLSIEVADQSGMMLLTDKAKEYHQYASSSPPEIPRMQK